MYVRVWLIGNDPHQKLRCNKTKEGPAPYGEIQKKKLGAVLFPEQLIWRLEVTSRYFTMITGQR